MVSFLAFVVNVPHKKVAYSESGEYLLYKSPFAEGGAYCVSRASGRTACLKIITATQLLSNYRWMITLPFAIYLAFFTAVVTRSAV